MAHLDYVEALLELCDGKDLAMIDTGDVKIVFNQALGSYPDDPAPTSDQPPADEGDTSPYGQLMNGSLPKFNNED